MPPWLYHTFATMALWGAWGVLSKPLSNQLSAWQVQSLSTIGLVPVIIWLARAPRLTQGTKVRCGFWQAFAAGGIASAGNVACYQALAVGGNAASVIPFTSLYPLVTVLLAVGLLGERLNRYQLGGIGASLIALYLLNVGADAASPLTPWLGVALIPVLLWGVSALLQKIATTHGSPELVTLAFLMGFLPLGAVTPAFQSFEWNLAPRTWFLLIALGFFFALGNLTLIHAYGRGGRASVVTPLASLYSIVTIPIAIFLLGERPGPREGLGILVALAAIAGLAIESPAAPPAPASPGPNQNR
ncbi:MAG: DMT family transporter [Verrucomicrobiales bacterium]|nr:DMT family transporter [Verrucomicrobiales bacterium]